MSKFIKLFKKIQGKEVEQNHKDKKARAVFLSIFIFIIIFALGIFYLGQINKLATLGFRLHELETATEKLERANKNLELKVTSLQSLNKIKDQAEELSLVRVDEIEYLYNYNIEELVAAK